MQPLPSAGETKNRAISLQRHKRRNQNEELSLAQVTPTLTYKTFTGNICIAYSRLAHLPFSRALPPQTRRRADANARARARTDARTHAQTHRRTCLRGSPGLETQPENHQAVNPTGKHAMPQPLALRSTLTHRHAERGEHEPKESRSTAGSLGFRNDPPHVGAQAITACLDDAMQKEHG